jgi:diguanylate cyclase (GGDEF)-like protein
MDTIEMLRARVDGRVRGGQARKIAPAPVRVLLITIVAGVLAGVVGGSDGFWLSVPAVLLAGSIGSTAMRACLSAAPVLLVGAVAASVADKGSLPPIWMVLLVPGACMAVLQMVSGRLQQERDVMQRAAFSDPLTGLANRRMLMSMAGYEIARHHRADARFTLVMLDLDGFKLVNDRYGHAAGDQMLCEVGAALTRALRTQDTIARLGGDEFCVIAPETENPRGLAEKIVTAVTEAVTGYESLQTSIGLSVFPEDGTTIELLLRTADDRLLAAKRRRYDRPQRRAAA